MTQISHRVKIKEVSVDRLLETEITTVKREDGSELNISASHFISTDIKPNEIVIRIGTEFLRFSALHYGDTYIDVAKEVLTHLDEIIHATPYIKKNSNFESMEYEELEKAQHNG